VRPGFKSRAPDQHMFGGNFVLGSSHNSETKSQFEGSKVGVEGVEWWVVGGAVSWESDTAAINVARPRRWMMGVYFLANCPACLTRFARSSSGERTCLLGLLAWLHDPADSG
jgi:hypothetical protein